MNPHPDPTAIELRSADFSPPLSGPPKTAGSGLKSAFLSCRNSLNSTAVPPDPLPFPKGEGNSVAQCPGHRIAIRDECVLALLSPLGAGIKVGSFRLHSYGEAGSPVVVKTVARTSKRRRLRVWEM